MIYDQLLHAQRYQAIHQHLRIGLDALLSGKFNQSPDGRYELLGQDVYALVQTYTTKPRQAGKWEAHRKYTDVQFMVEGSEMMGHTPLAGLREMSPFDPAKDIGFYTGGNDPAASGSFFQVNPGQFAIFFPHDAHMPSLAITEPARVRKIVLKIALPER